MKDYNRQISFTSVLKDRVSPQHSSPYPQQPNILKNNSQRQFLTNQTGSHHLQESQGIRYQQSIYNQPYNHTQVQSQYNYTHINHKFEKKGHKTLAELLVDFEGFPDNEYTLIFNSGNNSNDSRNESQKVGRKSGGLMFQQWIQKQAQKENYHHNQLYTQENDQYRSEPQSQDQIYHKNYGRNANGEIKHRNNRVQRDSKARRVNLAQICQDNIDQYGYEDAPPRLNQCKQELPSKKLNINHKPFQRDIFQSSSESQQPMQSQQSEYGHSSEQAIIESLATQELQRLAQFTESENKQLLAQFHQLKIDKVNQCQQIYQNNRDANQTKIWLKEVKNRFVEEVQIMAEEILRNREIYQAEAITEEHTDQNESHRQSDNRYRAAKNQINQYLKLKNSSRVQKIENSDAHFQQSVQKQSQNQNINSSIGNVNFGGVGYSFANEFQIARQVSNEGVHEKRQNQIQQKQRLSQSIQGPLVLEKKPSRPSKQKEQLVIVPNVSSIQSQQQIIDNHYIRTSSEVLIGNSKLQIQRVQSVVGNFTKKDIQSVEKAQQIQRSDNNISNHSNTSSRIQPSDVRIVQSKLIFNGNGNGISLKSDINDHNKPNIERPNQNPRPIATPGTRILYDGMLQFRKRYPSIAVHNITPQNQHPFMAPTSQNNQINDGQMNNKNKNLLKNNKQQQQHQPSNGIKFQNFFARELQHMTNSKDQGKMASSISQKPIDALPMIRQSKGIRSSLAMNNENQLPKKDQKLPPNHPSLNKPNVVESIKLENRQSIGQQSSQSQSFVIEFDLNTSDA